MPLFCISNITSSVVLGVWKITETPDCFLSCIRLSEEEQSIYSSFKHDTRRKQWLSYRLLIKELFNSEQDYSVTYDDAGKPILVGSDYHISVSHAGDYSSVIISKISPVGVDIENIHPRLFKVTSKFLNSEELLHITGEDQLQKLTVYWCAKEALYKLCGVRHLAFADDIFVHPFDYQTKGVLTATVFIKKEPVSYTLYYTTIDNYILVYVY